MKKPDNIIRFESAVDDILDAAFIHGWSQPEANSVIQEIMNVFNLSEEDIQQYDVCHFTQHKVS